MPAYGTRYLQESFKQLDPNTPHTVYRDNRPLAKQMNTPWFDANPPNFTTTTGGPRAVTVIGWKAVNSGSQEDDVNYGSIRVTYYVTFRG